MLNKNEVFSSKIAYVVSQFPEVHETFILREITEFQKTGVKIIIFSLRSCRDKIIHPEAKKLINQTFYSPFLFSWDLIRAQILTFKRSPLSYLSILLYIIKNNWCSPSCIVKLLAIFPKSVYYAKIAQEVGVDHLHAHWASIPTASAVIISKLTDIPFSFTAHAYDIFKNNTMLKEKICLAEFVVTCTRFNKKYLETIYNGFHSEKIVVNYHGVDITNFTPRNFIDYPVKNNILSIGRLTEQKGFPYLIKACSILQKKGLDFQCKIIGEGPEQQDLIRLVKELKLEDRVKFLGLLPQSEILKLYQESTVFVLPCVVCKNNDRDGIPNVIIEALAVGLPVISTEISGIPEIILHEKTGLLVPEKNVESLANATERMLKDSALRKQLEKNGRNLVENHFDIRKNVDDLEGIFRTFLWNK